MGKKLRLDSNVIANDCAVAVSHAADLLLEEYFNEIQFQMSSESGRNNLDAKSLDDGEKRLLKRLVIGGAWAIMDSYGTGSLMDRQNPFLADYISSPMWNSMRGGFAIAGRPAGSYVNIFGEQAESSGSLAGQNVERVIPPRPPSKAFQQAQAWFASGDRVNKRLTEAINAFFAGARANPTKYFRYG